MPGADQTVVGPRAGEAAPEIRASGSREGKFHSRKLAKIIHQHHQFVGSRGMFLKEANSFYKELRNMGEPWPAQDLHGAPLAGTLWGPPQGALLPPKALSWVSSRDP